MTKGRPLKPALLCTGAFALVCIAIAVFELFIGGPGYFEYELAERADQNRYHMPVIETFAAQLPAPDLVSYPSATTPGYHLALAVVWRITESDLALRLINILVGSLLLFTVIKTASRWTSPIAACALALPFACNTYVIGGTAWLTTDNAALLFVALALASALKPVTTKTLIASGLWGAGAVLIRQVHMWVAGAPALAGALASPLASFIPLIGNADSESPRSMRSFVVGASMFALPTLVVAGFALAWGGLVPVHEEMRAKHGQGLNPATFAYALAIFGAYSIFFASLYRSKISLRLLADPLILASGFSGFVIAMAFETDWERKVRDYGWLWSGLVKRLDFADAFGRSPIIAALAVTGAAALAFLAREAIRAGRKRETVIILVMSVGWVLAQSLNSMCWQRYVDPPVLICICWLAALGSPSPHKRDLLGPAVLAFLLLGYTFASFARDIIAGNLAI